MDALRIEGGHRLAGTLTVDGAKNAALPALAAALLGEAPVTLRGVPPLEDIQNMIRLLKDLGCDVQVDGETVRIETVDATRVHAPYDTVRTMRASLCVLGPLLAARGQARVAMPGGCAIGDRPVDLHLRGLEALGARVRFEGGDMVLQADTLKGATVFMGGPMGPTVLGTANVLCAAVRAKGQTIIESAACEPEIAFLARMLRSMGADISGEGTPRMLVNGVDSLKGVDTQLIPDRIVAGTLAVAAAMTNGDVTLKRFPMDHLVAVLGPPSRGGRARDSSRRQRTRRRLHRAHHHRPTAEADSLYNAAAPGFPTDLQAQVMSLLCLADGNSIVTEKIYPDRFQHVPELGRMGLN